MLYIYINRYVYISIYSIVIYILIGSISHQSVDLLAVRVFIFLTTLGCLNTWIMQYAM